MAVEPTRHYKPKDKAKPPLYANKTKSQRVKVTIVLPSHKFQIILSNLFWKKSRIFSLDILSFGSK
jgi:hypothetical protein